MGTFGQRLQREREMRGITLEEIATSTKIGTRSLRALEEEDFDQLPGGIFNKGFVRAYAKYLGIDEEQAVADYLAAAGEVEQPLPEPPERPAARGNAGAGKWVTLLVVVALAAGGYAGWRWYQKKQLAEEAPRTAMAVAIKPVPPAPAAVGASPSPDAQSAAATPTPAAGDAASGQADAAKPADTTAEGFLLEIRAKQGAWIQYSVDDEPRREVTLKANELHEIHAQKRLRLVLGNAGGVEVSFNGKALPALGPVNQARTLSFTPEGLQR